MIMCTYLKHEKNIGKLSGFFSVSWDFILSFFFFFSFDFTEILMYSMLRQNFKTNRIYIYTTIIKNICRKIMS